MKHIGMVLVFGIFGVLFLFGCSGTPVEGGPDSYCPDGLVELPDGSCAAIDGDVLDNSSDSGDDVCFDNEYRCGNGKILYVCVEGDWVELKVCGEGEVCDVFAKDCTGLYVDGDIETELELADEEFDEQTEVEEIDLAEDYDVAEERELDIDMLEEDVSSPGILRIDPARDRALLGYDVVLHAMWKASEAESEIDVTSSVLWASSDESVLATTTTAGVFRAVSAGSSVISISYEDGSSDSVQITVYERVSYEARGLWVTRWAYSSASDVRNIIRRASQYGFNQVYFQVRGRCDAFYHSHYEPWASELTGHLGQDPGWDPLQVAVEEAHQQGIELHAYINILTMWSGSNAPPSTNPQHVYNLHPEWIMVDSNGDPMPLGSGYVWMSPGVPAVWDYTAIVVEDIIENYDVDGIHMDRIRYPGTDYSFDETSNTRYAQAVAQNPGLSRDQWERDQITALVSAVYDRIQAIKPRVVLSAATIGIYKRPSGWSSSSGWSDYLQDPYAWDELGVIDVNIPMVYWHIRPNYGDYTDFRYLVDDHVSLATNRFVYIGSDFDDSSFSGGYIDSSELSNQVNYVRESGAMGNVFFDYTTLNSAGLWNTFGSSLYSAPAVVPWMPWKH